MELHSLRVSSSFEKPSLRRPSVSFHPGVLTQTVRLGDVLYEPQSGKDEMQTSAFAWGEGVRGASRS